MLVKLEKEIELEETLLMTEEPPPAVKTFSVCCQHGGLYQSGVSSDRHRQDMWQQNGLCFSRASVWMMVQAKSFARLQLITLASLRWYMCDPVEGEPGLLPLHWRPTGYDAS